MKKLQTAFDEHGFKIVWTQDGRIMYWDAVSDRVKLYYNECVRSWHSAMLEPERKNFLGHSFLIFSLCLSCLFLGISYT